MKLRKDYTQARFNEENSTFLFGQILVVSVILGLVAGSWWIFGVVLIGLIVSLQFRRVAVAICFIFALAWGGLGIAIGMAFESVGAIVVLAILGFLIGLGGNLSGLQWARDVTEIPDEEYGDEDYDDYNDTDEEFVCPKCNAALVDRAVFCAKCGNKI